MFSKYLFALLIIVSLLNACSPKIITTYVNESTGHKMQRPNLEEINKINNILSKQESKIYKRRYRGTIISKDQKNAPYINFVIEYPKNNKTYTVMSNQIIFVITDSISCQRSVFKADGSLFKVNYWEKFYLKKKYNHLGFVEGKNVGTHYEYDAEGKVVKKWNYDESEAQLDLDDVLEIYGENFFNIEFHPRLVYNDDIVFNPFPYWLVRVYKIAYLFDRESDPELIEIKLDARNGEIISTETVYESYISKYDTNLYDRW